MNTFIKNAYKNKNRLILVIFLVSFTLLIRLSYFFILISKNPQGVLTFDSYPYLQLGENIWNHQIFSRLQNSPYYAENIWVPFYPLIIGLFGKKIFSVLIFQIMLCGLNSYQIIAICRQLNLTTRYTILTTLLYAVNLNSCIQSTTILTEMLCETLVLGATLCLALYLNKKYLIHLILSSLLFGLVLFTKPIFLWVLPVLFITLIIISKKIKLFILLLFPLIIYTAWSFRNYKIFNKFFYANIDIQNLAFFRAAQLDAYYNGLSIETNQKLIRTITVEKLKTKFNRVHEHDTPIFYNQLRSDALNKIKSHPIIYLKLNLLNAFKLIVNPCNKILNYQFDKNQMHLELINSNLNFNDKIIVFFNSFKLIDYLILLLSITGSFICIIALFASLFYIYKKNNLIVVALSVLILTLFALSIGPEADARLRYMFEPLSMLLFGKFINDFILNNNQNKIENTSSKEIL